MGDSQWHIYRVHSGKEVELAPGFGHPVYIPHAAVERYNRRMRKVIRRVEPALPGFVFVCLPEPQALRMRRTRFHIGFMKNGDGTPCILNFRSYLLLLLLEKELMKHKTTAPNLRRRSFQPQDRVLIGTGALEGLEAIIQEIKGEKLLLNLVKGNLRVAIPSQDVALAA